MKTQTILAVGISSEFRTGPSSGAVLKHRVTNTNLRLLAINLYSDLGFSRYYPY